jgi:hypothetical protein
VPPRHLPPRSGARMHLQVPHRPGPAGGLGGADLDRVPPPPIMRPLCRKLGALPLGHLRQRLPGGPRFHHVSQRLTVIGWQG